MSGSSDDGRAFKDDPAAFLENHYVSFTGINYGSLPGAYDELLFQMSSQRPHPGDRKQDDLFVVTHDRRYALDVEVAPATFKPQYEEPRRSVWR